MFILGHARQIEPPWARSHPQNRRRRRRLLVIFGPAVSSIELRKGKMKGEHQSPRMYEVQPWTFNILRLQDHDATSAPCGEGKGGMRASAPHLPIFRLYLRRTVPQSRCAVLALRLKVGLVGRSQKQKERRVNPLDRSIRSVSIEPEKVSTLQMNRLKLPRR